LQTDDQPRYRISVKQSSKGVHQFDCTLEWRDRTITLPIDESDAANIVTRTLGVELLEMLKATEEAFKADGRRLVIDLE